MILGFYSLEFSGIRAGKALSSEVEETLLLPFVDQEKKGPDALGVLSLQILPIES